MKIVTLRLTGAFILTTIIISCKKEHADPYSQKNNKPDLEVTETLPPVQTPVHYNLTSNCGGFYQALPARYDSTSKKYPLLIFLHGKGELGNGTTDLSNLLIAPIPRLINKKKFPPYFKSGKESYSFVVLSPQFKKTPSPEDVNTLIEYAKTNLRVDASRIYITGLSMGGGATWDYAGKYASKIAAIVPVCGASVSNKSKTEMIAKNNLPIWALHNNGDDRVSVNYTLGYINALNASNMKPKPHKTIFPVSGHDAWTKAYDLAYKENNMNIYEWMLQYHR